MIILKVIVLCISVIHTTATEHKTPDNRQHGSTTSDLLAKFHQNDYKIKFERAELIHFNKQYLKNLNVVTYKYNRTSAVVNMTWLYRVDVHDYNVMFQAYRFASNEYRLFPLRFQFSLCEAIKSNVAGLQAITSGVNYTGCPFLKDVPAGVYNWSPDEAQLPPFIPDGQYMLDIQALLRNTELYRCHLYATVYRPIIKK